MKSEKMLFYLIVGIVIFLFLYIVYNLILKTCGCSKEGFAGTESNDNIYDSAKIYNYIKDNIGDNNCKNVGDSILASRFMSNVDKDYVKYNKDGKISPCDPKTENNCFMKYNINRGSNEKMDMYIGSTSILGSRVPVVEENAIIKTTQGDMFDKFIKNVVKKFTSILSYTNLNLKDNTDEISGNYVDISVNNFTISDYSSDINFNSNVKNLITGEYVDMSYNYIFSTGSSSGGPITNIDDIPKDYFNGKYNFIGCNLWQKANVSRDVTKSDATDDTNINFYIKYVSEKFLKKLPGDSLKEGYYFLYNKTQNPSGFIYLLKINDTTTRTITAIQKSLEDINTLSSNLDIDYSCIKVLKDTGENDCSNNPVITGDNFKGFIDRIIGPIDSKNQFESDKIKEIKEICNDYCFIKPEHKYYFDSEMGDDIIITKESWGNDTIKNNTLQANWCADHCPYGRLPINDISNALKNIPSGSGVGGNEGNTEHWAKKFGCSLLSEGNQGPYPIPPNLVESYKKFGITPRLDDNNVFTTKDNCQEGAKNYAKFLSETKSMKAPNPIVQYYDDRRSGASDDPILESQCDKLVCDVSVNVFHNGVPYIVWCEDSSCKDYDTLQKFKDSKCSECAPKLNTSLLSYMQEYASADPDDLDDFGNYSETSSETVKATLENPEGKCGQEKDWMNRLKRDALREIDLDDIDNIRRIGQEFLSNLCSCMGYKTQCVINLLEQERMGRHFINYAQNGGSIADISEIASNIIKVNKFDLYSDMFGEGEVEHYNALWDLNISHNA